MSHHTRPEQVRDLRRGHWFVVHNCIFDDYVMPGLLTTTEAFVYFALCRRAADSTVRAGAETLAKMAHVSDKSVRTAIAKLEKLGLVRIERTNDPALGHLANTYYLLEPTSGNDYRGSGKNGRDLRQSLPKAPVEDTELNKKDVKETTRIEQARKLLDEPLEPTPRKGLDRETMVKGARR